MEDLLPKAMGALLLKATAVLLLRVMVDTRASRDTRRPRITAVAGLDIISSNSLPLNK
jgi:hypothetical protein